MRGEAGMGAEATEAGGMGVTGASGMEAIGGMEATGGEAHGLGSASASDLSGGRIGGRIGGHTGADTGDPMPMATPMATRPSSPCPPPKSMCNPQHRPPPSPLRPRTGITATKRGAITPMSSSAPEDGER
jgi:hypothetical protein